MIFEIALILRCDIHECMAVSDTLDWSLLQVFLSVAETGSLSAAARALGQTQPTVGRHIQSLEASLDVALFKRQARGMALTAEGEALLDHARAMRGAADALQLQAAGRESDLRGTVRITASEFVSLHFLPRMVAEARDTYPEIEVEIVATDRAENLLFREADIAIRMFRPTQLNLVAKKIGVVELGLFGSVSYIQKHGYPMTPADMAHHNIIGADTRSHMIDGFRKAGMEVDRHFFPVRCDTNTVTFELVRAGAGLGFGALPMVRRDPNLRAIDFGVEIPPLEIWLTAHDAVRRAPRVEAIWDLLADGLSDLTE